ncbi:MAG TPA: zinc ribbon domain-containing protein [Candidatus Thermoplasmatota archaeon]|nr:zinc ribbon domain-containing protein [Candidatus Thermoplasmatota archaeon]
MQFTTREELGRWFVDAATRVQQGDFGMAAGVAGMIFLFFFVMLAVQIVLAIWVYTDAQKRGDNAVLWLLIVLLTGLIGVVIWLVVRPPERGPYGVPGAPPPYGYASPPPGYAPPYGAPPPPYAPSPPPRPVDSTYPGAPSGSGYGAPNVFCPTCNAPNAASNRFCAACGRQLVA